jgi:hypothetical protein
MSFLKYLLPILIVCSVPLRAANPELYNINTEQICFDFLTPKYERVEDMNKEEQSAFAFQHNKGISCSEKFIKAKNYFRKAALKGNHLGYIIFLYMGKLEESRSKSFYAQYGF